MKFVKLLDIVKTGLADQDEATRSFIKGEIVKMLPRKLTTKDTQKIEALRNLTGVFIDSTGNKRSIQQAIGCSNIGGMLGQKH